jgi:hypothetical protein
VIDSKDEYNSLLLIYGIENSKFSNAVSPSARDITFQLFDIFPEIWFHFDLRVNIGGEFIFDRCFIWGIEFFNFL